MEKEEIILQKRLQELAKRSYDKGIFCFTEFLDLAGQDLFFRMERELSYAGVTLFGGNEECDRKVLRFGNSDEAGYEEVFPISCIQIEPLQEKFSEQLSHRDYLGALMNLGIERSNLGDIQIKGKKAYFFCLDRVVPYLLENLSKVRHTNVRCSKVEEAVDFLKPNRQRETILCPSERIDVVIARLFHFSRTQSVELFRGKKVFVNSRLCENNSCQLKENDVVSVRGFGKFQYLGNFYQTKKGKLSIQIDLYQ